MTESTKSSDVSTQSDISISQEMMTLEPRYLFDAAGVATAAETAAEQVAQDQADQAGNDKPALSNVDTPATNGLDRALREGAASESSSDRQDIVFVDTSVENYEQLLAGISPSADVVLINGASDGLSQIANALEGRENVDGLHIISHGGAGRLNLGGESIDFNNLSAEQRSSLETIGSALSESADILIYGCDFGAGAEGQSAVESFADLTGADIAASDDLTGTRELGGDYELEINLGSIETTRILTAETAGDWRGTLSETVADITGANFGTSGAGNPLSLWIDTSDTASILDSGGGSISDGEAVGTIRDKSGQGNDLTADIGEGPLYTANDGGNPALTFDGVNDLLKGDFDYDYTNYTLFVVLASNDVDRTRNNTWIAGKTDNGDDRVGVYLNDFALAPGNDGNMGYRGAATNNGGAAGTANNDDGGGNNADAAVDDGFTKTYGLRVQDNDQVTADLNGSREQGTAENLRAADIANLDNQLFTIGGVDANNGSFGNRPGVSKGFDGSIREVILFNRALNDAEMEVMNNYLSQKWGTDLNATQENFEPTGSNHNENVNGITVQTANDSDTYIPGSKNSAASGGLTLTSSGFLQDDAGDGGNDSFYIGHDTNTGVSAADLGSSGTVSRAAQTWFFDIRDTNTNNGAVDLSFDLGADGLNISGDVSNGSRFALLFRSGTSGDFSRVGSLEGTRSGDSVSFDGVDISTLSGNGFYTLGVLPANADPVIANLNGDTVNFTEDGAPVAIDQNGNATVSDVDSPDLDGGTLTVSISANGVAAEDVLSIGNIGDISVSGNTISFQGDAIATFSGGSNGQNLVIAFNSANATPAAAQALIRAVQYQNVDTEDPTAGNRTVSFVLADGDGGVSSASDVTVNVIAVNDQPTLTATGDNPTFREGNSPVDLFSNASADPIESNQNFNQLILTLSNVGNGSNELLRVNGQDIVLTVGNNKSAGTIGGDAVTMNVSISGGTATITLNIDGDGLSASQMNALINGLAYSNSGDDPTANGTSRTATITSLRDTGGTADGGDDTNDALNIQSNITVEAVNDQPTLTATGNNPTFTEDGAAVDLFNSITINTVEAGQTIEELRFTVSNVTDGANEIINIDDTAVALTDGNSGSTTANGFSYSISLSGTTATVTITKAGTSVADAQTLVDGLSYQNNSQDPTAAARIVTLTSIQDSGGTANGGDDTNDALNIQSNVTVQAVNDEPTLTATGNNPTFTEDGSAVDLFRTVTIDTVEAGQTIEELRFTVSNVTDGANEIINIDGTAVALTNGNNGSTTANGFSYSVSLSGTTATVVISRAGTSVADAQTLVDGLSYQNNSQDPTAANRVVTLTSIQDSGGTANGGDDTNDALNIQSNVTVLAVNDQPTLTATGNNPTFTEDGAAADLFNSVTINTVEAGQTIEELRFTVSNVTDGANEIINIDGTAVALTAGNNGSTTANGFSYSVSLSGTTATVVISRAGTSVADAQTLVDGLSYQNNSQDPTAAARVVTLTSIQDSGGTANGGDDTNDALNIQSTVTVQAVNDEPTLTAIGNNPTFTEDGAAVDLFRTVTIDTVEAGQTIEELRFTVSNVTDGANEIINIDGTAVALTNGNSGSTTANGFSYSVSLSGTTATITITKAGTSVAEVQTLVDGLSYQNNSQEPTAAARVATLTFIRDSGGTANGGDDSNDALNIQSSVTVLSVNDEPTLTATGNNPTFTEDGAAVDLFSTVTINTVESGQTIEELRFTVSNVTDGANEIINIDGTAVTLTDGNSGSTTANGFSYSISLSGTTATVVISRAGTSVAEAQTLVDGLSYQNNSQDPTAANRIVTLTSIQDSGGTANGGDDTNNALNIQSSVTVQAVNDQPTLTATGNNPTFTEDGAAVDLFNSVTINTVEAGQTIAALRFTVSNVTDGANEIINIDGTAVALTNGNSGSTTANGFSYSISLSGGTATVMISRAGTSVAEAQTLVDGLSYQNNSQDPTAANRVVTLTFIQDSGGTANGGDDTNDALNIQSSVTVEAINDAPTVSTAASYNFGDGPSLTLSGTLSIADVDAGTGSLTVTLSVGQGTLNVVAGSSGALVANSGTANVTVSGTLAQINDLLNGNNGASVTYVNNAPSGANTSFTLTANDRGNTGNDPGLSGDANSEEGSATVNILFNQPPQVDLNGGGVGNDNTVTYTENDANTPVNLVPIATITESGNENIQSITLSLENFTDKAVGSESITIGGVAFIIDNDNQTSAVSGGHQGVYDAASNTLTITLANGTNAATAQALLRTAAYSNNSDNPSDNARTVGITVTDVSNSASTRHDVTINVVPVNDAPVISNPPSDVVVIEDTPSNLDLSAITLSDVDANNGNITVTLTVNNGTLSVPGGDSGGVTTGLSNNSRTLTLTGTVTAIDAYLNTVSNIQYTGAANASGDNADVLMLTINDNGNTGGGNLSDSATINIDITAVDDPPVLTDLNDADFNENDVRDNPQIVDADVTLSDVDGTDLNGGNVTFSLSAATNFERLNIRNQGNAAGQIGVDGNNITFGGVVIGSIDPGNDGSNGGNLVISLNNNATLAAVEALIENLTYQNTSDNPAASRTLSITVTDGNAVSSGPQTLDINIIPNNDPPTINLDPNNSGGGPDDRGFSVGYLQGNGPVNVTDNDISIVDPDNPNISRVTLTTSGFIDGAQERLIIGGTEFPLNANASQTINFGGRTYQVDVTNNGGTITITPQGGGQLAAGDFQALVADIQYNHTGNPSDNVRTIDFTVNDGLVDSLAARSTISVPPNEAPVVNLDPTNSGGGLNNGNFEATYTEGQPAVRLSAADASLADNENDNITQLTFTLGGGQDGANEALSIGSTRLSFSNASNGASVTVGGISYDVVASNNGLTLALVPQGGGSVSLAEAQSLLRAASYENTGTGSDITTGQRTVTVSVNDSLNTSNLAVSTITVVEDNIAPTVPTVNRLVTNDNTPIITGTYDSNDAAGGFQVTVNGVTYVLGTDPELSTNGDNWTLDLSNLNTPLADGVFDVVAQATDAAGNSATDAGVEDLVIDTQAPPVPIVTPQETNDTTPTITGTATLGVGETLTVTVNNVTYTAGDGNLSVDTANNTWSLNIPDGNALAEGTFDVTATITDLAGNASSDPSTAELVIDLTPPTVPTVTAQVTNDNTPTITGTATIAAGETLSVVVNGVTYTAGDGNLSVDVANNTWSLTIPDGNALPDGTFDVTATVTDLAGNASSDPSVAELTIDTGAPAAPTVTAQTTNDTTPTITGTATLAAGETLTVVVNGVTYTAGDGNLSVDVANNTWTLTIPDADALPEGTFDVTATVTDLAGNASNDPSTAELVIDLTPPTVNSITTSDPTPNLTGSGAPNEQLTVTVDADGDGIPEVTYQVTTDADGNWLIDPDNAVPLSGSFPQNLADGTSLTINAVDGAGNSNSGTITLQQRVPSLDLATASDSAGDSNTDDITNDNTPTINSSPNNPGTPGDIVTLFDSDGTTVLGSATVQADGSWSITPTTPLADGVHNLTARYTYSGGVQSQASAVLAVTIDTQAPSDHDIDQSSAEIAGDGVVEAGEVTNLSFTGSGGLPGRPVQVFFTDSLGNQVGPLSIPADSSGNWAVSADVSSLADGAITISAFVVDAAGNIGTAITRSITKDTFTPEPTPDQTPDIDIDTGDQEPDTTGGNGVLGEAIADGNSSDIGLDTDSGNGFVGDVVAGGNGRDIGFNTDSGEGFVGDAVQRSRDVAQVEGEEAPEAVVGDEQLGFDPNDLPGTESGPTEPTPDDGSNRGSLRVTLLDTSNSSTGSQNNLGRTELIVETSVQQRVIDIQLDLRRSGISVESGVRYEISLVDGSSLPEGLTVDLEEGSVKGLVPIDLKQLDLLVKIILPNGQVLARNISVDVETAQTEETNLAETPNNAEGVALLSSQIEQVSNQFDQNIASLHNTLNKLA